MLLRNESTLHARCSIEKAIFILWNVFISNKKEEEIKIDKKSFYISNEVEKKSHDRDHKAHVIAKIKFNDLEMKKKEK